MLPIVPIIVTFFTKIDIIRQTGENTVFEGVVGDIAHCSDGGFPSAKNRPVIGWQS